MPSPLDETGNDGVQPSRVFRVSRNATVNGVDFSEGDVLEVLREYFRDGGKEVIFRSRRNGDFKVWTLGGGQFDYFEALFTASTEDTPPPRRPWRCWGSAGAQLGAENLN